MLFLAWPHARAWSYVEFKFSKKYRITYATQSVGLLFDLPYTLNGGREGQINFAFRAAASLVGSVFEPNKKGLIF
jgi:hypothetical protein